MDGSWDLGRTIRPILSNCERFTVVLGISVDAAEDKRIKLYRLQHSAEQLFKGNSGSTPRVSHRNDNTTRLWAAIVFQRNIRRHPFDILHFYFYYELKQLSITRLQQPCFISPPTFDVLEDTSENIYNNVYLHSIRRNPLKYIDESCDTPRVRASGSNISDFFQYLTFPAIRPDPPRKNDACA